MGCSLALDFASLEDGPQDAGSSLDATSDGGADAASDGGLVIDGGPDAGTADSGLCEYVDDGVVNRNELVIEVGLGATYRVDDTAPVAVDVVGDRTGSEPKGLPTDSRIGADREQRTPDA